MLHVNLSSRTLRLKWTKSCLSTNCQVRKTYAAQPYSWYKSFNPGGIAGLVITDHVASKRTSSKRHEETEKWNEMKDVGRKLM